MAYLHDMGEREKLFAGVFFFKGEGKCCVEQTIDTHAA